MEARGGFEKGRHYTREQIRAALGGSRRTAFPTQHGSVVCLCLQPALNPRAPEEVVVGGSERIRHLARALGAAGTAVPVFVRRRQGWECAGVRRVRMLVDDPGALLAMIAEGAPPDASLALLLEEVADETCADRRADAFEAGWGGPAWRPADGERA